MVSQNIEYGLIFEIPQGPRHALIFNMNVTSQHDDIRVHLLKFEVFKLYM